MGLRGSVRLGNFRIDPLYEPEKVSKKISGLNSFGVSLLMT